MQREWRTEWIKVRYRKVGLLLMAFLMLIFLWVSWALSRNTKEEMADGYRMIFLQLPMIHTILAPTMLAMLASRLCDAEVKGDTLKLLCTLEHKGRLFDMKLLMGACYLALFVFAEVGILFIQGAIYHFQRPLEPVQILFFVFQIYLVSFAIFLLQVVLSFFFENQILPLAIGLLGSFVGLFSWFFANGIGKLVLIWAYYSQLCFVAFDWEKETRVITYYNKPFDVFSFVLLIVLLVAGYVIGKSLFLRKEI